MRRAHIVSVTLSWLALAVACDRGSPPIDVCMGPAPVDDPLASPDGCATPPTGDWMGTASIIAHGGGSQDGQQADVRWTLAERAGCVDHYRPSGTAQDVFAIGCCCVLRMEPRSVAIAPTDGELVIDRSTAPATYRVNGATKWDGIQGCPGQEIPTVLGGEWVNSSGAFEGDVISGGVREGAVDFEWRFTRANAAVEPPADCTLPPREAWTTTFTRGGARRTVTWPSA